VRLSDISANLVVLAGRNTKQIYNDIRYRKFKSELHRLLYYWLEGYDASHPWGIQGRPPFPETVPLQLVNNSAGIETRELLVEKLDKGQWESTFRRLLKELDKEYRDGN